MPKPNKSLNNRDSEPGSTGAALREAAAVAALDPTPDIAPRDRLSFTFFAALALHAALILGLGFSFDLASQRSPTIEVTLAQYNDGQTNPDADFMAQTNQIGSGDEAEVVEMTAVEDPTLSDSASNPLLSEPTPVTETEELQQDSTLSTLSSADAETNLEDSTPTEELLSNLDNSQRSIEDLAREIASLEARVALDAESRAKGPRTKRLTSVSTKSADEAAYLDAWRQRVERVGNTNALADTYGSLRMLAVIRADGSLQEVRILTSSGKPALDEAALRIVRQGAPYPPFTAEMRKNFDVLEIDRTWQFERRGTRVGG